ncbi:hypothetical protein ACFRCI_32705 [Streptomyces sp. NPDC056638]|uniref:hypothetical protein n=1 Tax=Streptomyces sp. NPDC056638 TaxID=3345887 RepID=UPI00368355C9
MSSSTVPAVAVAVAVTIAIASTGALHEQDGRLFTRGDPGRPGRALRTSVIILQPRAGRPERGVGVPPG